MMFQSLREEVTRMALEKGTCVDLYTSALLKIQENEELEKHHDLEGLFYNVRTYLEDWCLGNIKGQWRADKEIIYPPEENSETILRFQFSSKREAVRFKLTWGGR